MEPKTSVVQVKAGTTYDGNKVEVTLPFDPGADLTTAVEIHGEAVVFGVYKSGAVNSFTNALRSCIGKHLKGGASPGETPNKVKAELVDWKLGIKRRGKDKVDQFLGNFDDLTPERQLEVIELLKERAAENS